MTGLSSELAEFSAELRPGTLPQQVLEAASATTGNVLALAAGAAEHPAVHAAVRSVRPLGGAAEVPLLGRTERLPAIWAALVHGIAAHVEDFDDTHPPTVIHPGAPVVPAALSAAARTGASGAELLAAVTAGVEASLRVGNALMPAALDRGWHMTGIAGPIGAALAAGKLFGLSVPELVSAVGIAATQSAGVLEALGSMAKPLHPGKAASNGVEAALFAGQGLDGPATPIEGRRGLLALHTGEIDVRPALDGLGTDWEITRNEIKPYACGVVSHSIIDLATALAGELSAEPVSVTLRVNPFVLVAMGRTAPETSLQAKFSATHCFAAGFTFGAAGPEQFAEQVVRAPEIRALRDRCELVAAPELGRYAVHATIRTGTGESITRTHEAPTKLDAQSLHRKAIALTEPVLGTAAPDFVAGAFAMHEVRSVTELLATTLRESTADAR